MAVTNDARVFIRRSIRVIHSSAGPRSLSGSKRNKEIPMMWSGTATILLFVASAVAQDNVGAITGTMKDPDGGTVAGATVQAKHTGTGTVYKADTPRAGTFTLQQLPAGTYELSVPAIGFTFIAYTKKDLIVEAGKTLRADIQLQWAGNLGTVGDDTFLTIRNRYAGITGPAPRTPDGKPDFSGVWNGSGDPNPEEPAALPGPAAIKKERVDNDFKDAPSSFCLPGEVFPSSPLLYKFVHAQFLLIQLIEDEPNFRQIFLDGRSHPKDPDPTWKGHSIGRWQDDTLVVDTVGFNDKNWLPGGYPATEKLHVVERYRRPDLAHLVIDVTIEDPEVFMKPWNLHMTWELAPGEELIEYICAENNLYRSRTDRK
jgi:hypothetical protein